MKITDNITIDWHHDVPNKTTSCVLTLRNFNDLGNDREVSATSKCGHGDQFSRKTGRKLSLTRVLKIADLKKDIRTSIWAVIWSRGVKI